MEVVSLEILEHGKLQTLKDASILNLKRCWKNTYETFSEVGHLQFPWFFDECIEFCVGDEQGTTASKARKRPAESAFLSKELPYTTPRRSHIYNIQTKH